MSVHWIRALHRELQREVVMPAAAVAHHLGWEPVGEPSVDAEALRAQLAAEQAARGAQDASPPPPAPALQAPTPKAVATNPEPPAPSGADPKE